MVYVEADAANYSYEREDGSKGTSLSLVQSTYTTFFFFLFFSVFPTSTRHLHTNMPTAEEVNLLKNGKSEESAEESA